ncbi:MAG: TetR family transcriptional regulator [Aquisalimonadaceae bacterium]
MVRRTKAEAAATRDAILDGAEAVFFERGVAHTSLEEIARRAGVTRGAVYWHFRNKNAVFDAMLERVQLPLDELIIEIERQSGADPMAVIREIAFLGLRKLAENERYRRVYTIVFHRCEFVAAIGAVVQRRNARSRQVRAMLEAHFARAQRLGQLRTGLTPAQAASAFRAFMVGIHDDWLRDPEQFDLSAEGPAIVDVMLAGLSDQHCT